MYIMRQQSSFPFHPSHGFRNRMNLLHRAVRGCAAQMVWPEGIAVETWDAWFKKRLGIFGAFLENPELIATKEISSLD